MAENKKSFILYCDLIHTFENLQDKEAGRLIKHILRYVNDLNPEAPDKLTKIAFEPIKHQMKRDLIKYEGKKKQWSEAGQASAKARALKKENERSTDSTDVESRSTDSTVNDTVNVTVNVIKNNIEERKLKFASTLKPFLVKYGKEMLNNFYTYWTEPNKSNTKFKQELQKTWSLAGRLETWAANEMKFGNKKSPEPIEPPIKPL